MQAVEHYEIARYGLLRTWASKLGYDEAAELLGQTLEEEKKTDALLSEIAESLVYEAVGNDPAGEQDEPPTTAKPSKAKKAA